MIKRKVMKLFYIILFSLIITYSSFGCDITFDQNIYNKYDQNRDKNLNCLESLLFIDNVVLECIEKEIKLNKILSRSVFYFMLDKNKEPTSTELISYHAYRKRKNCRYTYNDIKQAMALLNDILE